MLNIADAHNDMHVPDGAGVFIGMKLALLAAVVLRLSHTDSPEKLQELAGVTRSITEINRMSVDMAERSITFDGTAEQNAIAEWLVPRLDVSGAPPAGGPYKVAADDIVRVFYLANAGTPQQIMEVATVARSMAEVRRAFVYQPARAFVVRGRADQLALLEWLLPKLDVTGPQTGSPQHLVGRDDIARVFYVRHAQTPQQLQEMTTTIRSTGDILRAFNCNTANAVVMRATPDQIALAEFLFERLDKPSGEFSPAGAEYRMIGQPDGVVRVFALDKAASAEAFQQRAKEIRVATGVRRAFMYSPHRALVLRGTPDQIAEAERLVKARP